MKQMALDDDDDDDDDDDVDHDGDHDGDHDDDGDDDNDDDDDGDDYDSDDDDHDDVLQPKVQILRRALSHSPSCRWCVLVAVRQQVCLFEKTLL